MLQYIMIGNIICAVLDILALSSTMESRAGRLHVVLDELFTAPTPLATAVIAVGALADVVSLPLQA